MANAMILLSVANAIIYLSVYLTFIGMFLFMYGSFRICVYFFYIPKEKRKERRKFIFLSAGMLLFGILGIVFGVVLS